MCCGERRAERWEESGCEMGSANEGGSSGRSGLEKLHQLGHDTTSRLTHAVTHVSRNVFPMRDNYYTNTHYLITNTTGFVVM